MVRDGRSAQRRLRASRVALAGAVLGAVLGLPSVAFAAEADPTPAPATPSGPVTRATTTTSQTPESKEEADAWRGRDLQLFEVDALHGGVGLLHTQHAQSGAPGQFRLAFTSEFFDSGFLCSSSYPCPSPTGGKNITSDSLSHLGGTLTVGATITNYLEAYASTGAYGNADNANHPSLLQVFGDTQLGIKVFHPLSRVFHVGGVTELDLVNGSGSVGLAGSGTGAKFRLLGTADLRGKSDPFPLRISLNATYALDNSAQVVSGYEAATGGPITRIERFGLDLNRVDHFDISLGAETFLAGNRVRPFLEYGLSVPINRQGYVCDPNNVSGDHCLGSDVVVPSQLTIGSRFFPWKHGFSLVAALDIGVSGVHSFIEETSPTPPWMLYAGASWAIDTWSRPPVERTLLVSKVIGPRPQGQIRGLVHPKDEAKGIDEAYLAFDQRPEITTRVTAGDGRFSVPVDPGTYTLLVHAKGYRDGTCGGVMGPNPVDVEIDCPLEPALVQVTATEITIQQQIQFQVDSAIILAESDGLMREIADTLIKNPRIQRVEVQGHTDSTGTAQYNQTLSEQRATAVKDWLTAHGVAPDRLVAHGYGKERPLIPNVTKGMKAMNRRVQFIIEAQTLETSVGK